MTYATTEKSTKMLHFAINDLREKENCFTFHRSWGRMACLTNENVKEEMIRWKKMRKEGKLVIQPCNSHDIKIKGKDWFVLTVQPLENNDVEDVGLDPMGIAQEVGILVTGYLYFFKSKKNRDAVQTFVM
jgi:hypothetical protein